MIKLANSLNFAKQLDKDDSLSEYRNLFHIPKDIHDKDLIYFCGNSLGLQPKSTKSFIDNELKDWANLGVKGWSNAKNPWLEYHSYLTNEMANIVGAKPLEVVVMNTLTVNLHLMMVSFYKPTDTKFKIIYAVESQLIHHGYNANDGIILWETKNVENKYQELENIFLENKNEIALVLIGGVNYYTGEYFNLKKITEIGHKYNSIVGFDCAHAAGNVQLNLNKVGADFAIWCSYKYLNSGPGSLSGCFVHERHAYNNDINRFRGWWGNDLNNRFNMREPFQTIPGADGWQISTPTILSMAAIKASLDLFEEVGMDALREKSEKLTGYFEFLINQIETDRIRIITPKNPKERGCQLSIQVKNADKSLHQKLMDHHIITDWREPDVIRCAPVPMYNSFEDVYQMVSILKELV